MFTNEYLEKYLIFFLNLGYILYMTLYAGFIMAIDAQVSDAAHWPLVLLCYVVDMETRQNYILVSFTLQSASQTEAPQ